MTAMMKAVCADVETNIFGGGGGTIGWSGFDVSFSSVGETVRRMKLYGRATNDRAIVT